MGCLGFGLHTRAAVAATAPWAFCVCHSPSSVFEMYPVLFRRELGRSGLPLDVADAGIVGVVGGLLGAKLLWTG